MSSLAPKTSWPIGTRVIYEGDFGSVPCMTMSTPYELKSVWRVGINASFVRDLSIDIDRLELAPTWEVVGVRWETRIERSIPVSFVNRKTAVVELLNARSFCPDPSKVTLVRITTKRKVKP